MIICVPFLGTDIAQFDKSYLDAGLGIEMSIFDRQDIMNSQPWESIKANAHRIMSFDPPAAIFHFPVNDCDYLYDKTVRNRLYEVIDLIADIGMDGLVLHSNRIAGHQVWSRRHLSQERGQLADFLEQLNARIKDKGIWVGMENMPLMGNDALDYDPILVYPQDTTMISYDDIGLTWDFCHYSYTVEAVTRIMNGTLSGDGYPPLSACDFLDFKSLTDRIYHYHFSAFRGFATTSGGRCREGFAPWEGDVEESVYDKGFQVICQSQRARTVTLEIAEANYVDRTQIWKVVDWCRQRITDELVRV